MKENMMELLIEAGMVCGLIALTMFAFASLIVTRPFAVGAIVLVVAGCINCIECEE